MSDPLFWEASYAIAVALQEHHPDVDLENVSLDMVYQWVLELPDFDDEPGLANDEILFEIYKNWLENTLEF